MIRRQLIIPLLVSLAYTANAQTECHTVLERAEQLYVFGDLEQVVPLLRPCLNSDAFNNDRERLSEAWRLLGLSHLYMRNMPAADSAFLQFLRLNPSFPNPPYRTKYADPQEMIHRMKNLVSRERFTLSLEYGRTSPYFRTDKIFSGQDPSTRKTYSGRSGNLISLSVSRKITSRLHLKTSLSTSQSGMLVKSENNTGRSQLSEKQRRTELSTAAGLKLGSITISTAKIRGGSFFVFGGLSLQQVNRSLATLIVDRSGGSDAVDLNYSSSDLRITREWRPFLEAQLSLPSNPRGKRIERISQTTLSMRFDAGVTNQTNPDNRNAHLAGFDWVEDDFRRSSLTFTIGRSITMYRASRRASR